MSKVFNLHIPRWLERLLEAVPAFLSLGFLSLIIILSFVNLQAVTVLVIGYVLLWTMKIIGYSLRLIRGYQLMRNLQHISWNDRLQDIYNLDEAYQRTTEELKDASNRNLRAGLRQYRSVLLKAQETPDLLPPDSLLHAVIIATYNEDPSVVESTIQAVANSEYNLDQVMLIIAYEERGGEHVAENAKRLAQEYGSQFNFSRAIMHPANIPGEAKAKAGNITYAARWIEDYVKQQAIDPEQVLITTLDADNRPSTDYLAYLSYIYCISRNRTKKSYQPMAMFFNNIWDVPAISRVIATNNSFWLLMEAMRPHRLRNFSAHAQSLKTLIHTDYWNVRSIVEDGHQYWRTYFAYDGEHTVVPLYTAIYQDAVLAETYRKTFYEQFKQLRRWAWGVSDTPYVIVSMVRDRTIPFRQKALQLFRQIEGYFSWAVAPIVLAVGGWIPYIVNRASEQNLLIQQLPELSSRIQTIALLGLLGPAIASALSFPPLPDRYSKFKYTSLIWQWALIPVAMITFGSVAALNAQVRLAINKPLEQFDVTVKHRKGAPNTDTTL